MSKFFQEYSGLFAIIALTIVVFFLTDQRGIKPSRTGNGKPPGSSSDDSKDPPVAPPTIRDSNGLEHPIVISTAKPGAGKGPVSEEALKDNNWSPVSVWDLKNNNTESMWLSEVDLAFAKGIVGLGGEVSLSIDDMAYENQTNPRITGPGTMKVILPLPVEVKPDQTIQIKVSVIFEGVKKGKVKNAVSLALLRFTVKRKDGPLNMIAPNTPGWTWEVTD